MEKIFLLLVLLSNCCYAQQVKSFKNGDIQLFYEEYGQGPALYILTGGPGAPPEYPSHQIIDSLNSFYTCGVRESQKTSLLIRKPSISKVIRRTLNSCAKNERIKK